jgi:hypothetical protein
MNAEHDDLIDELTRVADSIDERALTALREAVASGAAQRPDSDRYLTQARRAIEKAIQALRRASGADAMSGDD